LLAGSRTRIRVCDELRNLNRGLWHGKLVAELRDSQPRVYRRWQEFPETVCPPGGETIDEARERICRLVDKIRRKHRSGSIAIVVPEPAASILRQQLSHSDSMGDLWRAECRCGQWETIDLHVPHQGR
jgi:broad specificity phosphatase PhoE